jgi:hypothetical protein
MKIRTFVLLAFCGAFSTAFAGEGGMSDAKRQEMFGKMKEIKLAGMRERISIMQQSVGCVQSASSPDAMKSCEQSERSAMENHQRRMKERWESNKPR